MHSPKECCFDHERLEVYQESIAFIAWLSALLDGTVRIGEVKDQLDRASTSIPLNIAEGNGKYAPKDRCRFFDIAHGSTLECAAGLDILVAKAKLTPEQIHPGKKSSKNRPDAHGVDQKELDTRISQRRRGELRPAPPRAPALALSPLPDLTLHLSLSLMCEPLGKPLMCEPLGIPPIEG